MQLKNRIARYLGVVLPCTLILAAAPASAELYQFTYTYSGSIQSYGDGSQLTGFLEGTLDPNDPTGDSVLVTGFGSVSLIIPKYGRFDFPTVEADEFNVYPVGSGDPVVTFSGNTLMFRACPSGFTVDSGPTDGILDDCPLGEEGGFWISTVEGWGSAAIGGGIEAVCYDSAAFLTEGCRVFDFVGGVWQMTLVNATVDPTVDLDPTVTLGDNTTLDKDVAVEENVTVGDNVTLDKGSSIGADSAVGADTTLDQGTSIGSNVTIGANVTIDADVEIQDGVTIGDNVQIGRGAVICAGITIGESATIGKNAVVDIDVDPAGAIAKDYPGTCEP